METLANLALGMSTAFTPSNLGVCLMGTLIGTLIGVLPGIGPTATIAMLLPLTFSLPPEAALIMLSGIFYGAQYGGSTTAILVNLPGEASSVITTIDGYQMARNGRAGPALAIAGIGSFVAGTIATALIVIVGPTLAGLALYFGAAEYFSLMVLGLVAATVLANGDLVKALGMIFVGLLLGLIGTDVNTGAQRYTFGLSILADGLNFIPLAMGMFGLAEIIKNLGQPEENRSLVSKRITGLFPTKADLAASAGSILRATGIGSILGVLPGGGPTLAAFSSYVLEKKLAGDKGTFGRGDIRGVAAPEAANNAAAQTSFIPMLTLGLPSNAVMALMIGAMSMQGIAPGPQVMTQNPTLFWGLIVSMWVGNLMLLIINLPLVGVWVQLLKVPYRILFPAIVLLCATGVYVINYSVFEVYLLAGFGIIGLALARCGCDPVPLLLGFILGPMMEENLRRALLITNGDIDVFFTRPISAAFLALSAFLIALALLPSLTRKRAEVFQE
ncbi:tripartite tricarboxylate transporter permease [Pararhizobium sp. DWP3-4]|uniref:tripartite tricarboxylate transporter permease n=1 Tax=Pararhizobium sp. DWP3-4 TaxID=2804565 RepID=UPI003CF61591